MNSHFAECTRGRVQGAPVRREERMVRGEPTDRLPEEEDEKAPEMLGTDCFARRRMEWPAMARRGKFDI